ncbi:MAG: DegT/DnrJ/EryC1/StrS family aminotransferase [Deltaproteobacteria bacterium]|nr:DegT/DnrJ/EryC1/StrS family aminotransferase [Deltaproteobacteria bacterium]
MRIQRTIAPSASPFSIRDIINALAAAALPDRYLGSLERGIIDFFGVKYAYPVSSGKAALYIILKALSALSPERRKVVIPAYTCFSVPSAVNKAGLDITLCDSDPATLDFDYSRLDSLIDDKTLCVVPNHLFGAPSDMTAVKKACEGKGVFIVEDAAQAMGCSYNGKLLGTIGDAGFFSFGRGKNVTCGSGGLIITNSPGIAMKIISGLEGVDPQGPLETMIDFTKALLTGLLIRPDLYWLPSGLPFLELGQTFFHANFPVKRLSGMKAGLLLNWAKRLEAQNRARARAAEFYKNMLALPGDAGLPYLRFPVLCRTETDRESLFSGSKRLGLGLSKMYPTPVNEINEIKDRFKGKYYPGASLISKRLIALPTHGLVTDKDFEKICALYQGISAESAQARTGDNETYNYN